MNVEQPGPINFDFLIGLDRVGHLSLTKVKSAIFIVIEYSWVSTFITRKLNKWLEYIRVENQCIARSSPTF